MASIDMPADLSDYEQERLQQIAQNRAMLESLGLGSGMGIRAEVDEKRRTAAAQRAQSRAARAPSPVGPADIGDCPRRSSRLQGKAGPDYRDLDHALESNEPVDEEDEDMSKAHKRKDVYTVRQLNTLGSCRTPYDEHPDRLTRKASGFGVDYKERCRGVVPCHWHRHNTRDPHVQCSRKAIPRP